MDNIIEPSMDFDFSKLYLASPSSLTGGAYFTRIFLNNKPLYIQTPKSLTKQGFIKSGKKMYTDLMFDNNDTILINWLENLESRCQELIHEKGDEWFESKLDKSDIETAFTSTMKLFKSGKFYLLRVNVKSNIKIYNEVDEVVDYENIKNDSHIISILEIQGIKFTSRNFQIEIELKQSMIVSPDPFLDECFIKNPLNMKKKHIYLEEKKEEIKEKDYNEFSNSSNKEEIINNELNENNEFITNLINNDENINLEIEDFPNNTDTDNLNELTEVHFNNYDTDINVNLEPITLQKPNEVYYKIYKAAREKAKQAKKEAIIAYLEVKNIKKTYMLDNLDESDESDMDIENISESEL
jgi:hypothetical protein